MAQKISLRTETRDSGERKNEAGMSRLKMIELSINGLSDSQSELSILEAGCGPGWPLRLEGIKYRLTGIDLDEAALKRRKSIAKDLDEAIVADLRYVDLGGRKFDVIYNAFVLEHVEHASVVLERFVHWLRPGGLLLLLIPDRESVFGFVTRMTPYWFHVAYHKYVLGKPNAGRPGFGPYPTHYHKVVSRSGIREFCASYGLSVCEERGSCTYEMEKNSRARLVRAVAIAVSLLSLGKLPWKHNNLTYVIKKGATAG